MIAIDGMDKTHSKLVPIQYNVAYCFCHSVELSNVSIRQKPQTRFILDLVTNSVRTYPDLEDFIFFFKHALASAFDFL